MGEDSSLVSNQADKQVFSLCRLPCQEVTQCSEAALQLAIQQWLQIKGPSNKDWSLSRPCYLDQSTFLGQSMLFWSHLPPMRLIGGSCHTQDLHRRSFSLRQDASPHVHFRKHSSHPFVKEIFYKPSFPCATDGWWALKGNSRRNAWYSHLKPCWTIEKQRDCVKKHQGFCNIMSKTEYTVLSDL